MTSKSSSVRGFTAWHVGLLLAVVAGVGLGIGVAEAAQSNCDCYYTRDCPDKTKMYCNRKSACKRNCVHEDDLSAPTVPVTAQCDGDPDLNGPGPCWDNEPQPPVGTDGDGAQCDPPENTTTHRKHKIMDGNCTWNDSNSNCANAPADTVAGYLEAWTEAVVATIEAGGGAPPEAQIAAFADQLSTGCAIQVSDVGLNITHMGLGDYFTWPTLDFPHGQIGEIPDDERAVAMEVATQAGLGVAQQIRDLGGNAVEAAFYGLSADASAWVQNLSTHCQYPHPEEHGHEFPFIDGIDCLIEEITGTANSLISGPVVRPIPMQTAQ